MITSIYLFFFNEKKRMWYKKVYQTMQKINKHAYHANAPK